MEFTGYLHASDVPYKLRTNASEHLICLSANEQDRSMLHLHELHWFQLSQDWLQTGISYFQVNTGAGTRTFNPRSAHFCRWWIVRRPCSAVAFSRCSTSWDQAIPVVATCMLNRLLFTVTPASTLPASKKAAKNIAYPLHSFLVYVETCQVSLNNIMWAYGCC